MARLYHPFWVGVTILLSAVFGILFFPVVHEKYGLPMSIALTLLGVAVIWIIYIVRAQIFSSWSSINGQNDHHET